MDETAYGFETDQEKEYRELLEELESCQEQRAELLAALEGLFANCAMAHKYWGDGCNLVAANNAIADARAAIAKAKGGA